MKKLTLLLLLTLSIIGAKGQTFYAIPYDTIRVGKPLSTNGISLYGKVYFKNVTPGFVKLNADGKVINTTILSSDITGLQDSLTKKVNRTFDNLAAAAIPISKLSSSTISGVSLGSNLNSLTLGNGLTGTSYNGSAAVTARADTSVLRTVSNSVSLSGLQTRLNAYLPLTGGTVTGDVRVVKLGIGLTPVLPLDIAASSSVAARIAQSNGFGLKILSSGSGMYALQVGNAADDNIYFRINNDASIYANSLSGSGNIIVGSDNSGVLNKISIGSGLSLSSGTLSATGGSSGTVTTPGMTAGRLVVANSASDIGTTTALTISGSDLDVTGDVGAATFTGSGASLTNVVNSITGTSNQVIASASTGAVTLSLPQSIATTSAPSFASVTGSSSMSGTVGNFTNGDATNGYGVQINSEGTASTRYALSVRNLAGTQTYLHIPTETGKLGSVVVGSSVPFTGLSSHGFTVNGTSYGSIGLNLNDVNKGYLSSYADGVLLQSIGRLVLNNNTGNVVIGTTTDDGSNKFQLTGNAAITGNITANNLGTASGYTATSSNTALTIPLRDSNGDFSAGTVTAALSGNASTATALQTARTIAGVSFDGTSNISLNNNAITNGAGYITSAALSGYAPLASPTFTGTVSGISKSMVGLSNVDNTSDANKPVSTATQTALDLKANIASPTFTGTVSGITKSMVGLGSVDNTSDAGKPVSTATQTALDLKANIASPALTGTPTAPTAASGTSTTQIATTAFVNARTPFIQSGTYSNVESGITSIGIDLPIEVLTTTYQVQITPGSTLIAGIDYYVADKTTGGFTIYFLSSVTGAATFDWTTFH